MSAESTRVAIEIGLALLIIIAPIGFYCFYKDRKNEAGNPMGVGARAIQLLAVVMIIPAVLILALERILEGAVVGTLIGTLAGFILSNVGEFKNSRKSGDRTPPG